MRANLFKSVLAMFLLLGASYAQETPTLQQKSHRLIITDIDDTVKLTDNAHALDSFVRATFSRKAFAGISTLYRELTSQNESSDLFSHSTLYFVSGGPQILRKANVGLISQNQFPAPWLLTMRKDLSQSITDYKLQKISEIIERLAPEDQVILIGDDGEQDPETYAEVLRKYPSRVESVYIHRIKGRALPAGEISYDTPMDIAILEMEKGKLKPEQVMRVGQAVLSEGKADDETLVIHYNYCPMSFDEKIKQASSSLEAEAYSLSTQIHNRLKQVCQDRLDDAERAKLYYYSS